MASSTRAVASTGCNLGSETQLIRDALNYPWRSWQMFLGPEAGHNSCLLTATRGLSVDSVPRQLDVFNYLWRKLTGLKGLKGQPFELSYDGIVGLSTVCNRDESIMILLADIRLKDQRQMVTSLASALGPPRMSSINWSRTRTRTPKFQKTAPNLKIHAIFS